jgi:hypothetical protein
VPLAGASFLISFAVMAVVPIAVDITQEGPVEYLGRGAVAFGLILTVGSAFWLYHAAERAVVASAAAGPAAAGPRTAVGTAAHVLLGAVYFIVVTAIPLFATGAVILLLVSRLAGIEVVDGGFTALLAVAVVAAGALGGIEGYRDGPKATRMAVFTVNRILSVFDQGGPSEAGEHWRAEEFMPHRWGRAMSGWVGAACGVALCIPLAMLFVTADAQERAAGDERPEGRLLVSLITGLFVGALVGMYFGYAYGMTAAAIWSCVRRSGVQTADTATGS